jgi:hypothetical protein
MQRKAYCSRKEMNLEMIGQTLRESLAQGKNTDQQDISTLHQVTIVRDMGWRDMGWRLSLRILRKSQGDELHPRATGRGYDHLKQE